MKGIPEVVDLLNELLAHELAAINQYWVHYKMCENWGYKKLAEKKRSESIEEMRHADAVIARILFLDGTPNMQRLSPVAVGEDAIEQHEVDLKLELEARERLGHGIVLCYEKNDHGTRELLEHILKDEEEGIDWLEAQLHLAKEIGKEQYLAQQIG